MAYISPHATTCEFLLSYPIPSLTDSLQSERSWRERLGQRRSQTLTANQYRSCKCIGQPPHHIPPLSVSRLWTASSMLTYLSRFFPDGQVLSLLANEEYKPALVIPMLKPSLRMKVPILWTPPKQVTHPLAHHRVSTSETGGSKARAS
jgi:hypothetical protein